jgi:hypothetical protein
MPNERFNQTARSDVVLRLTLRRAKSQPRLVNLNVRRERSTLLAGTTQLEGRLPQKTKKIRIMKRNNPPIMANKKQ